MLRQQFGNYVSLFHRKFKTHRFLNTDVIIDKIKAAGVNLQEDNDCKPDKIKNTIKVLRDVTESDWNNSALLESEEFRVAVVKAYKMVRKNRRLKNKMKRKWDEFEEENMNENEGEQPKSSKRRRYQHKLPVVDRTLSDESDDSDVDLELPTHLEDSGTGAKQNDSSPSPDSDNCSRQMTPSPTSTSHLDHNTATKDPLTAESSQSFHSDQKSDYPETSASPSPSPTPPRKGHVQKCYVCRQRFYTASKVNTLKLLWGAILVLRPLYLQIIGVLVVSEVDLI